MMRGKGRAQNLKKSARKLKGFEAGLWCRKEGLPKLMKDPIRDAISKQDALAWGAKLMLSCFRNVIWILSVCVLIEFVSSHASDKPFVLQWYLLLPAAVGSYFCGVAAAERKSASEKLPPVQSHSGSSVG
jgi:hypothetical protein